DIAKIGWSVRPMVGFLGVENPRHVAILMAALRDYCRDADIGRECPERGEVARLLVKAFRSGANTPDQLKAAVKAELGAMRRQSGSPQRHRAGDRQRPHGRYSADR